MQDVSTVFDLIVPQWIVTDWNNKLIEFPVLYFHKRKKKKKIT